MDALLSKFPHLDHFLNAYMHQDWRLSGDSLHDVLLTYAKDTSPDDLMGLQSEIGDFIQQQGSEIEARYYTLFPNSAIPSGWDMKPDQWLNHVAQLTGEILPRLSAAH